MGGNFQPSPTGGAVHLWRLVRAVREELARDARIAAIAGRQHGVVTQRQLLACAGRLQRKGLTLHRSPSLQNAAATTKSGIRVTTAPRTLTDLRSTVPPWEFRRAVRQAEFLDLATGLNTDGTPSDPESAVLRAELGMATYAR
jgi:hypothetical protein